MGIEYTFFHCTCTPSTEWLIQSAWNSIIWPTITPSQNDLPYWNEFPANIFSIFMFKDFLTTLYTFEWLKAIKFQNWTYLNWNSTVYQIIIDCINWWAIFLFLLFLLESVPSSMKTAFDILPLLFQEKVNFVNNFSLKLSSRIKKHLVAFTIMKVAYLKYIIRSKNQLLHCSTVST